MKVCSKCKVEKEESEFGKLKRSKDGLYGSCRECNYDYYSLKKYGYIKLKEQEIIVESDFKICSKCHIKKNKPEFSKNKKFIDGLQRICKKCYSDYCFIRKYGFVPEKIIITEGFKICYKCKIIKNKNEFGILKMSVDGLNYLCKDCKNNSSNIYREQKRIKKYCKCGCGQRCLRYYVPGHGKTRERQKVKYNKVSQLTKENIELIKSGKYSLMELSKILSFSFGCINYFCKNENIKIPIIDRKRYLIGEKFGRLIVIDIDMNKNIVRWKCQCDCGKISFVRTKNLLDGITISCGCYLKEIMSKRMKEFYKNNPPPNNPLGNFYKKDYRFSKEQNKIILTRSSWETTTIDYFNKFNIKWLYEPKGFLLNNGHRYFPDFYLPELGIYLEIKGYMDKGSKNKIDEFELLYPKETLMIILKNGYERIKKELINEK